MKERLLNILDQSTCLTRRQMKDYLAGTMLPEEIHAAETHIASCPLCSMAVEGFETHNEAALEAIASLNSGFLKEHFDSITPQIHLNSMAPAVAISQPRKRKPASRSLFRVTSIAAALLVGFGLLWYFEFGRGRGAEPRMIAQNQPVVPDEVIAEVPQPVAAAPAKIEHKPVVKAAEKNRRQDPVMNAAADRIASDQVAAAGVPKPAPVAIASAPVVAKQAKKEKAAAAGHVAPLAAAVAVTDTAQPAPRMMAAATMSKKRVADVAVAETENNIKEERKAAKETIPARDINHLERGDQLFGKSDYSGALSHYRTAMNNGSNKQRSEATLMAARCYQQMGNKARAISLLQKLADDGSGAQKRKAKRLLKDLQGE